MMMLHLTLMHNAEQNTSSFNAMSMASDSQWGFVVTLSSEGGDNSLPVASLIGLLQSPVSNMFDHSLFEFQRTPIPGYDAQWWKVSMCEDFDD